MTPRIVIWLPLLFSTIAGHAAEPSLPAAAPSYVIKPSSEYWFRKYDLSPVKESWSMDIHVKEFERDLAQVEEIFAKHGATTTQPRELFIGSKTDRSQQLSYRLSRTAMRTVRGGLKKIGSFPEPIIRLPLEPISLAEVQDKIGKLDALKRGRAAELAGLAPADAIVDELLAHLLLVKSIQERADAEVQVNLTVRGAR